MAPTIRTGLAARAACSSGSHTTPTSPLAPGYVQANLLILPSTHAQDFRHLCLRNPVALPLLAESHKPGVYDQVKSRVPWLEDDDVCAHGCDFRRDASKFLVGERESGDVKEEWKEDSVAFLIGSSISLDAALGGAGLTVRHRTGDGGLVPMYRTRKQLLPSGVFYDSTYVVSMRPYKASEIGKVREATSSLVWTHGEPIDWGWGAIERLGISDIDVPEWGEKPRTKDGRAIKEAAWGDEEVPVFWASGLSAREAVVKAELGGDVVSNANGHYVVLDCKDSEIVRDRMV